VVGKNKYESAQNRSKEIITQRRLGRVPKLIAGVAILGTAVTFGVQGVSRAIERNAVITNETTVDGGRAEIVAFDADFEEHCWTSTTIQITGAGIKDELKVLGASVGWQEFKVDTQIENNLCIDGTSLAIEVDNETGHVNIDIPNKDSIKTHTEVVLGTIKPHEDQTAGYMLADNTTSFLESIPLIEDTGLSKDLSAGQDGATAAKTNSSLIVASKQAMDKCATQTWSLAAKPVESGIKRTVTLGLQVAHAMRPDIDPTNVSLTVEGKPFNELKVAGNTTNIDTAYQSIKKYDDGNENFTIIQPTSGTCEVSDEVKKIATETEPVVKVLNEEGVINE
jgi:hypothetical protein